MARSNPGRVEVVGCFRVGEAVEAMLELSTVYATGTAMGETSIPDGVY